MFPDDSLGWLFGIGLVVITAISLILSFWGLYIRSLNLRDGPALVPEKWGLTIHKLIEALQSYNEKNTSNLKKINESVFGQEKKADELMESFFVMREVKQERRGNNEIEKKVMMQKFSKTFFCDLFE